MSIKSLIREALEDVLKNGWTPESIAAWIDKIRAEATSTAFPRKPDAVIAPYLYDIFKKDVEKGHVLRRHVGIDQFKLDRIKPVLRQSLEDRIKANVQLIVLERHNSIDVAMARASGWLMSFDGQQQRLPTVKELDIAAGITKPMDTQRKYEHARRAIDQGHKLSAAIDATIAEQYGAIAAQWHAHAPTPDYLARPEHWERNKKVYPIKDCWATEQGLIKKGGTDWVEDITDPPSLPVNCTCYFTYLYDLLEIKQKAPDLLTAKGKEYLENRARPR